MGKKYSIAGFIVLVLFATPSITKEIPGATYNSEQVEEFFIRGDGNMDGAIDFSDVYLILRVIFTNMSVSCPDALDVNDDGKIDISDCIQLIYALSEQKMDLPPPVRDWGPDPTEDNLHCYAD